MGGQLPGGGGAVERGVWPDCQKKSGAMGAVRQAGGGGNTSPLRFALSRILTAHLQGGPRRTRKRNVCSMFRPAKLGPVGKGVRSARGEGRMPLLPGVSEIDALNLAKRAPWPDCPRGASEHRWRRRGGCWPTPRGRRAQRCSVGWGWGGRAQSD